LFAPKESIFFSNSITLFLLPKDASSSSSSPPIQSHFFWGGGPKGGCILFSNSNHFFGSQRMIHVVLQFNHFCVCSLSLSLFLSHVLVEFQL
jgi:hypothetical protein